MTTNCPPTELEAVDLTPFVRSELNALPMARGSWVWTIGPAYAGVFIWVPLLDRLGLCLAGPASLGWLIATAVLAVLACYFLLYDTPARWGWTSGRRLGVVGASTFGTRGSEWIAGVGVALGALAYYAISISMAIKLIMLGLLSCGLIDVGVFKLWSLGPLVLMSPVILLTAGFWIYVVTVVCRLRMANVISALMQVYTPLALMLLAGTALLVGSGLPGLAAERESMSQLTPALTAHAVPRPDGPVPALVRRVCALGLMGVEWGTTVRNRHDVRIGGWMGIILAGSFCSVMALLTVAGTLGQAPDSVLQTASELPIVPLSFHWAVFTGIGGIKGGVILSLFGVATLAPACYAAWAFRERISAHWTTIRPSVWTRIAGVLAFILVALTVADRLEEIFNLLGAIFAPVVGALVADALRQKGDWRGLRRGWSLAGLLAWVLGMAVGLVPVIGAWTDWTPARRFQPAALFAFLTAAAFYLIFAAIGLEGPLIIVPDMIKPEHEQAPGTAQ